MSLAYFFGIPKGIRESFSAIKELVLSVTAEDEISARDEDLDMVSSSYGVAASIGALRKRPAFGYIMTRTRWLREIWQRQLNSLASNNSLKSRIVVDGVEVVAEATLCFAGVAIRTRALAPTAEAARIRACREAISRALGEPIIELDGDDLAVVAFGSRAAAEEQALALLRYLDEADTFGLAYEVAGEVSRFASPFMRVSGIRLDKDVLYQLFIASPGANPRPASRSRRRAASPLWRAARIPPPRRPAPAPPARRRTPFLPRRAAAPAATARPRGIPRRRRRRGRRAVASA